MASASISHHQPRRTDRATRLRAVIEALEALAALVRDEVDIEEERAGDGDPLLTVAEAAAELRCSESLVRKACRTGALKAMGSPWRIRRSALVAYERRRTYKHGAAA